MSGDISADAVPITDHDTTDPINVITEPTITQLSCDKEEASCCKNLENINISNGENTSKESIPIVEPMAESSDSSDSNSGADSVMEYRNLDNQKNSTPENNNRQNQIQNQIIIQNPTGIVHLGPTYNINVGQAYTQVNSNNTEARNNPGGDQDQANLNNQRAQEVEENTPSKEFMRPLWYSNRVIASDELLRLSKNIGANWKSVGNGLKFNWAQLDQFESDTKCLSDAVHRMLFRWLQWKDQKATVGRLTKVLFNHKEYDAIRCLTP